MRSLEGLAFPIVIKKQEDYIERIKRKLKAAEQTLETYKDRQWELELEYNPCINVCAKCERAEASAVCRVCECSLCYPCSEERADDYEIPYISCGGDMCFHYG